MSEKQAVLPELDVLPEDTEAGYASFQNLRNDGSGHEPPTIVFGTIIGCRERQLLTLLQSLTDAGIEVVDGRAANHLASENVALKSERDRPETEDFFRGVPLETAHQRARWGNEYDSGKVPADWFWLVGYLAGKCLAAHIAGNQEKALHHTISTAAALANWHMAIKGAGNMRPGMEESK